VEERQMMTDCVVVGAGPAGLATSAALTQRGVDHVILERGQVGDTWRTQRWDSFRLNTPGWMNQLLGEQERYAYADRAEVVQKLEHLASNSPIHPAVRVTRLAPAGDGYALRTSDEEFRSRTVVVATGDQNVPRIPALARRLPDRVAQYHAADYAGSGQVPDGAVLVVGSGQSGCQIAEDLLVAGRRVVLATSPVARLPWRHRGRDSLEWLTDAGFFDQRPQDLPDPSVVRATQPIVASGGRSLSLQALARAGATLVGRLVGGAGEQLNFDDSAKANVAAGDAGAERMRATMDDFIRRSGLKASPAEPDDTDAPVELHAPTTLDMRDQDIGSVVWCTGFTGDFSWLNPSMLDDNGQPRREGPAAVAPAVWFVGLTWLAQRSSGIFFGFRRDAAAVADAVKVRLDGS
jgi:putative flavoprotein involved in K+ transport